jgi:hypothetical protein
MFPIIHSMQGTDQHMSVRLVNKHVDITIIFPGVSIEQLS